MSDPAPGSRPVTVVIPTIGRGKLLRACLTSLAACRPAPDEVLVVDQSHDPEVAALVREFSGASARLERNACARRAGRCVSLEQRVDAHRAGKPVGRSFAGWL